MIKQVAIITFSLVLAAPVAAADGFAPWAGRSA